MKTNETSKSTKKVVGKNKKKALDTAARVPDTSSDDVQINVDIIKEEASPAQQYVPGPIPAERHYEAFKRVEERIRARLKELPHEFYLTALRVAYNVDSSSTDPDVLPYPIEFGDMGLVDLVVRCADEEEITDEQLQALSQNASIPAALLDELYDSAKGHLQKDVTGELEVGIYMMLNGSNPQIYARDCKCKLPGAAPVQGKKRYTTLSPITGMRPRRYCTSGC